LALRDLQLLDGAFAEVARWSGVEVTDLDTASGSWHEREHGREAYARS
jgi:hypothetical protein